MVRRQITPSSTLIRCLHAIPDACVTVGDVMHQLGASKQIIVLHPKLTLLVQEAAPPEDRVFLHLATWTLLPSSGW